MIYVLAYPEFELSVWQPLAAFRSVHEPERVKFVAPHITLVFGLRHALPADVTALCERVASQTAKIPIAFSKSEVVYDPFENTHKIFLVTSVGKERLTALHEQLYDGPQRSELHPDMPYRPHMTVATNADRSILEGVDTTSIGAFPIKAKISGLDVVKLADGKLSSMGSIPLGG